MATQSALSEADLNGIVDGHIEPGRRAELLRRLAGSPADRARVEAWQEQNDLIRTAFQDVDREPLPLALDLAPPRLRCVDGGGSTEAPPPRKTESRKGRVAAGLATMILIAGGLGASWALIDSADKDRQTADPRLRGTIDATLAGRAATALDRDTVAPRAHRQMLADGLPTTTIPDLGPAGFSLTGAETEPAPASLVFHYRNGDAERVVISVARATGLPSAAPPARIGRTFSWHHNDAAYAIAGTVAPERLRAIAVALQGGDSEE